MCSLKPREERLVMSAIMQFDSSGRMLNSWMTAGVIRSAERMTYTNVNKVLEGDAEMSVRYAHLNHHSAPKDSLLQTPGAPKRLHRFRSPEPVIEFGRSRDDLIGRSERNIAHA
jgi:ribonuclease R